MWLERWAEFKLIVELFSTGVAVLLFLALAVVVLWVIITDHRRPKGVR
jgi:hypothetical protein